MGVTLTELPRLFDNNKNFWYNYYTKKERYNNYDNYK